MKIQNSKIYQTGQFLDLIVDSIRGLEQMAETIDFSLTSVDTLQGKTFSDFSLSLLQIIINNLGVKNYSMKNRCRMLTSPRFQRVVLPVS